MSEKIKRIVSELLTLTLFETILLIKEVQKNFNLESSSSRVITTVPVILKPSEEKIEEQQNSFIIVLTQVPIDKKIAVLKLVRTITGFGLKESKDIVDNVPQTIKEGATKEEAMKIKNDIEAAGGTITLF
jgi:large subunit ribosomal protein L7/L12